MLLFLRHLLLSGFLLTIFISICSARDTLNTRSSMQDGDNLVSEGKKFALEFFNPIGSNKRYLGVRYVDVENKVIWVANRDYPINDKSGVLKIGNNGNLVLIESKNNTIVWSPRGTFKAKNHTAQILDSGNLVLKEDGGSKILWQSFDYPTDTMIPGVKVGFNTKMHLNWSLTSWKADNDPSSGNHVYMMDHRGSNEIYIKTKEKNTFRMGPWNGIHFSDYPSMKIFSNIRFMYVNEETERYYSFEYNGKGSISRFVILPNGHLEFYEYSLESKKWSASGKGLNDECDLYSKCGSNGVCDMSVDGFCSCLRGYTPANRVEWENRYFKGGCKRIIKNLCHSGEGFRSVKQIKFPDIRNATLDYKSNDNIEDCRHKCLENCSCTAYSAADVSKKPSKGCILWYGDLNDIKQFNFGDTELFLRLPASELEIEEKKSNKKMFMIIIASVVASASFLIILFVLAFVCWKKNKGSMTTTLDFGNMQNPNLKNELEFFSLSAILSATRNFADDNKIGHGGFGSVFKGKMPNGVNIAVKRLFRVGGKGIQGNIFMNEAELIAKCQHKNLVRLLGCCIEGEERMLVFEFMQNSSLDTIIFGTRAERHKLNWKKRVEIIIGISKGLQYLHEDSRLKIVHRDIKAGNILLDEDMNPKITDFGTARLFGSDQKEDSTRLKVGTHGYMSPEYAKKGIFSPKSDVFSFGILLLEIISGKKALSHCYNRPEANLLELVWTLYNEENSFQLLDECMKESSDSALQVLRFVEIGLLCGQEHAIDRPDMSTVVFLLSNEKSRIPEPMQPGFCKRSGVSKRQSQPFSSEQVSSCSTKNWVTTTSNDVR